MLRLLLQLKVKISSDEDLERFVHRLSLLARASSHSDPETAAAASSNNHSALELRVDYRTPWHQVYRDVTTYFVQSGSFAAITRHLHALDHCSRRTASGHPGCQIGRILAAAAQGVNLASFASGLQF